MNQKELATLQGIVDWATGAHSKQRPSQLSRATGSIRARLVANRVRFRQWRQRKREALRAWFAPVSHGVLDDRGEAFFFDAHGFYVREGRLVFWCRCRVPPTFRRSTGIVEAGKWVSVIRGAAPVDDGGGE